MPGMDQAAIDKDFHDAVNMAPAEIEHWLGSDESKRVGFKGEDGEKTESVGHASGRRIIKILRTRKADLDDGDYAHMRKVTGYVKRHLAQRPDDPEDSNWRWSLMNWGHDPMKSDGA